MVSIIVRPSSDYAVSGLTATPADGFYWNKVSEVTPDTLTTYLSGNGTADFGTVITPSTGIISNVIIVLRVMSLGTSTAVATFKARVNQTNHGTPYTMSPGAAGATIWRNTDFTWTVNPATGVAWTWNDIATLKIGFSAATNDAKAYTYTTQVFAIINYQTPAYVASTRGIGGVSITNN